MPYEKRKSKNLLPPLSRLMKELAPKAGAKVIIEPEWKVAGRLVYKNGIVRSFFFASDLNPLASSKIANDKHFSKFFMKATGYPVVEGQTIFENKWAKKMKSRRTISTAHRYAKQLGYPLIAKPNDRTQGENVFLVRNERELRSALRDIFASSKVALLERYRPGRDYRIVVLDGHIIAAYERLPLSVIGDGRSRIGDLIRKKQNELLASGRDIDMDPNDRRIRGRLKEEGYTSRSVLPEGRKLYLLHNANLSAGGDGIDVTRTIHPGFQSVAVELTREMGLRVSGVDLMITRGDITGNPRGADYYIIEVNAAPGLGNFSCLGRKQKRIVEAMYLKIIKILAR